MHTADAIKIIVYDRDDADNRIASSFLSLQGKEHIPFADEKDLSEIISRLKARGFASKEVVILKKFKGRIFQKCPGSKNVICCNYHLLNICFDCIFDCTYCFLNSYLNSYGIVQFTNIFELIEELEKQIAAGGTDTIMRIGTGEFTDSLMMDRITGIGTDFIARFAKYRNIFLELKTKSSDTDHLLDIRDKGNAVLAWSLSTERNIRLYEAGTADLQARIGAAVKAVEAGYLTAFHLDPIIIYKGCLEEYLDLIDMVMERIGGAHIAWISMGCFRYGGGFKEILRERFPDELLTTEEMFQGPDGKFRYFRDKRVEIYRAIRERMEKSGNAPFLYLCMESADIWESAMGKRYKTSEDLESDMAGHLKKNFISPKAINQ